MKKYLLALLLLSACCQNGTESDCTVEEAQKIKEERKPNLLVEQDGVKVYWMKPCHDCNAIYFSTPGGTINWSDEETHGKSTTNVPMIYNGPICNFNQPKQPDDYDFQMELHNLRNNYNTGGGGGAR